MSNLVVTRGIDNVFSVVVARGGVAIDLTSATLKFTAKANVGDDDSLALISLEIGDGIVITNPTAGDATLTILGTKSASLSIAHSLLYYSLILDEGSGPEVLSEGTLAIVSDPSARFYIQVQDIRNVGLPSDLYSDAMVIASIKLWQQFIERATRQWFYPLPLALTLDGTDSDAIHFGVPCISISTLKINNDPNPLAPFYYRIYNNLTAYPADRQNPRVKLIDTREGWTDIYTAPLRDGRMLFRKGRQNQYIQGVFGYVEADGSAPEMIKRALTKLVVEKLTNPMYVPAGAFTGVSSIGPRGIVTAEWTDTHKLMYAQAGGPILARAPGLNGITDDQEILTILKLYKAPIGVATPNNPSYV